jgi:Fic family protein
VKRETFADSPSGRLVPTEKGQWAFVPHALPPPDLDIGSLTVPLERAAGLLGELNGIGRTLPDPYLLIRPLQVREAITSSSMEGTYTTVDELLLFEAGVPDRRATEDTREVGNYRRALEQAIKSFESLPLSLRTLRDAHRTLLQGVQRHRGLSARPGEFKIHQNFIGAYTIEEARFVPPPPAEALAGLGQLEKYMHRDGMDRFPDLVEAALIHYQFETIHPFADGNGRIGRMLITLFLSMRGAIRQPLLYVSPIIEKRKDEYIDLMFNVSRTGEWLPWIRFFIDVVARSCENAISVVDDLLALQKEFRSRLQEAGRSGNLHRIVDLLFVRQVVTVSRLADELGVTYRSAQLNIDALRRVGILSEVEGTANPRYYMATGIRDIIGKL